MRQALEMCNLGDMTTNTTPVHTGTDVYCVHDFLLAKEGQAKITRHDDEPLFIAKCQIGGHTYKVQYISVHWDYDNTTTPSLFVQGPRLRANGEEFTARWYETLYNWFRNEDMPADLVALVQEVKDRITN